MTTSIDNRELAVGRVYAVAALELAEEAGRAEEVGQELAALAADLEADAETAAFFASPLVDEEQRRAALERLRGTLSDLTVDTLQVMNGKGRLALVPALAAAYREELDRLRGRVDVTVSSARPLGDELRERLLAVVRERTGNEPRLEERVDSALLGGLVMRIGDRKIDASVAHQLRRIDEKLLGRAAGAAREAME